MIKIISLEVEGTSYCVTKETRVLSWTWTDCTWPRHPISGMESPSVHAPTASMCHMCSNFSSIFTNLSLSLQGRCCCEDKVQVEVWDGADGAGPADMKWKAASRLLSLAESQRPGRGPAVDVRWGLKLEPLHGSFLLLEDELALTLVHLWSQAGILLFNAKVMFN